MPLSFLDLKDISEQDMELVNPTSLDKVFTVGRVLGLRDGSRVIDFGCGYGEVLALWAEHFGITGVGIDVRETACRRAKQKTLERGLAGRIEIVRMNAAEYEFEQQAYDAAACIGASFIWGGYQPAIHRMKDAIRADGRLVLGEPYWRTSQLPPEYARNERVHPEFELAHLARAEGFDCEYVVRASHDDWDRYEAGNWRGLLKWLDENPDHPDRHEVIAHLHQSQDEYFRYAREYFGWAMYVLKPIRVDG